MKSRIKKIVISVAALVFVSSGVSFAHDSDKRHHKDHGKAYGHHKAEKHHSGWSNKHFKPSKHYKKQYRKLQQRHYRKNHLAGYVCEDGFYHYYDRLDHRWKSVQLNQRRNHHGRNVYKKVHSDDTYYRRHAPREDVVYKVALKDPKIVFKVIKRDHY